MKELNEGMDLIGWPDAAKKAFFGQLMPAHAESLKREPLSTLDYNLLARQVEQALGESMPSAAELAPPRANVPVLRDEVIVPNFSAEEARRIGLVEESAVDWNGVVDIDIGGEGEICSADMQFDGLPAAAEEAEPAHGKSLADHVQIGFAYRMHLEDKWQKVRLSHVSPGRSFFVFTHGSRHKQTISMTRRMLLRLCETGRLRAFENALPARTRDRARAPPAGHARAAPPTPELQPAASRRAMRDRRGQAGRVGPALAGDVERGAVVRAGAHERQPERHVDALLDAQVLDRNQTVVVGHRHDEVELAGWPAASRARMNTVSGAYGPLASMPSARAAATAGAMKRCSSSPNRPPSPACGFSPATAMRGCGWPHVAPARCAMRIVSSTLSKLTSSIAWRSATWIVTSTTRSSLVGQHHAHRRRAGQRLQHLGVAGDTATPAAASASLWIGAVTSAAPRPRCTRPTACSMHCAAARPQSACTRPHGSAASPSGKPGGCNTARQPGGTSSCGASTDASIGAVPSVAAARRSTATSPTTTQASAAPWANARTMVSGPMPTASPMVSSSGG